MLFGADIRTVQRVPELRIIAFKLASLLFMGCALFSRPASAQTAGTGALAGRLSDPMSKSQRQIRWASECIDPLNPPPFALTG